MKKLTTLAIFLAVFSTHSFAEVACEKVDEGTIKGLFDRWNESLQTGNPKEVSANYLSDAVLLPTISNQARLTDEERISYFEKFLAKKPKGEINSRTIAIGCNAATDNGEYTFTFGDGSTVKARYTFAYAWDGKEWRISSHHSSKMPEGQPG